MTHFDPRLESGWDRSVRSILWDLFFGADLTKSLGVGVVVAVGGHDKFATQKEFNSRKIVLLISDHNSKVHFWGGNECEGKAEDLGGCRKERDKPRELELTIAGDEGSDAGDESFIGRSELCWFRVDLIQ